METNAPRSITEPLIAQSRAGEAGVNLTDVLCTPVRLEITRHIAPENLWHWAVIFGSGHVWAVSESFESAEICVADASGAGMDALHGAELATRRVHNELSSPAAEGSPSGARG